MAQTLFKFSAKTVQSIKTPGRHSDGGGLYLSVSKTVAKSWVFFFKRGGKQFEMGLGSVSAVSLAEARDKAAAARGDLANGINPLEKRRREIAKPKAKTFGQCAEEFIEAHKEEWKSVKHLDQWRNSLTDHTGAIWDMPVNEIETVDVLKVLRPIWSEIAVTARRVRGRIENILDAAKAEGQRSGENPARWRGHLDKLLSKKRTEGTNYAALPYKKVPEFMRILRAEEGIAARALELTILTAIRSQGIVSKKSEGIAGACWSEIDFEEAIWTIPKARMKTPKDYVLPLSPRALEILRQMHGLDPKFIFPGTKKGQSISAGTMIAFLRKICADDATVHGFRATFKTWAADETDTEDAVAKMALAHTIPDKVEAAYNRAELLCKHRILMNQWEAYCMASSPVDGGAKVVPFAKQAS